MKKFEHACREVNREDSTYGRFMFERMASDEPEWELVSTIIKDGTLLMYFKREKPGWLKNKFEKWKEKRAERQQSMWWKKTLSDRGWDEHFRS